MNLRISARAQDDLEFIFAFVSLQRGPEAAERFLASAKQATQFLAQYPEAGPHPKWATQHKTLRFWPISRTNFLIFYLPEADGVSIERVLDGRRDVTRIIEMREDDPND